jgi:uncharacterized repeat protein (TIGR03803 family)
MKRVISALRGLDPGKRTFAVLVLCAATAIGLPAQIFTTVHNFNGTDGSNPQAGLIQTVNGNLFGTTSGGGSSNGGTVYQMTPIGTLTTLHSFHGTDGAIVSGLVLANRELYGTTQYGGAFTGSNQCGFIGCGTIFKIAAGGTFTTLYSFNNIDGSIPSTLIQGADGNLYGTTASGGANHPIQSCSGNGCGTIFKITPNGVLTTLYSFCPQSNCPDGANPEAGLVQANDGDFYGTTRGGGSHQVCRVNGNGRGCGTAFKITPNGVLTTLYSFCSQANCTEGEQPRAGLVQAGNGDLYGTTTAGGASNACAGFGCGTVFKITPSGALTTLHSFDLTDGAGPAAPLIQASDGNFYGTTSADGGSAVGGGTIFKITATGKLTTLHVLAGTGTEGFAPVAPLVEARSGTFYGTTSDGGSYISPNCPILAAERFSASKCL